MKNLKIRFARPNTPRNIANTSDNKKYKPMLIRIAKAFNISVLDL